MEGIVTKYSGYCIFCGTPTEEEHHLIFGNGKRKLADEDGLKVPCCRKHHTGGKVSERIHDNPMAEKLSKMMGQLAYEANIGTREEFRKRYGVSYL